MRSCAITTSERRSRFTQSWHELKKNNLIWVTPWNRHEKPLQIWDMSSDSRLSWETFGVNAECLLSWSLHDNRSFISAATFAHCCCFHAAPGIRVPDLWRCDWEWFGCQGSRLTQALVHLLKLWIITLWICQHQHLSAPQEGTVTHSSFVPDALSRLAYTSGGAPVPPGAAAIFTIPFTSGCEKEKKKQPTSLTTQEKDRN